MSEKKKPVVAEEAEEEAVETAKKPVAKATVKKDSKKEGLVTKAKRKVKENKKPIIAGGLGFLSGLGTAVLAGIGISKYQQKKNRPIVNNTDDYSPLDPNV